MILFSTPGSRVRQYELLARGSLRRLEFDARATFIYFYKLLENLKFDVLRLRFIERKTLLIFELMFGRCSRLIILLCVIKLPSNIYRFTLEIRTRRRFEENSKGY
jgi:hypothetical protein